MKQARYPFINYCSSENLAPTTGNGQDLLADLAAAVRRGHLELLCSKSHVKIPDHP